MDSMPDQKFIFGGVQVVANQMDTLLERELNTPGVLKRIRSEQ